MVSENSGGGGGQGRGRQGGSERYLCFGEGAKALGFFVVYREVFLFSGVWTFVFGVTFFGRGHIFNFFLLETISIATCRWLLKVSSMHVYLFLICCKG